MMIDSGDMKADIAWHVRDLAYTDLSLCPLSYSVFTSFLSSLISFSLSLSPCVFHAGVKK